MEEQDLPDMFLCGNSLYKTLYQGLDSSVGQEELFGNVLNREII